MVLLVLGSLLVATAGSLFLIRNAATSTAESTLTSQAQAITPLVPSLTVTRAVGARRARSVLDLVRRIGDYQTLELVGLAPDGKFQPPLPFPVAQVGIDTAALQARKMVVGSASHLVFVLAPIDLGPNERKLLPTRPIPASDTALMLVTRNLRSPVNGLTYFLAVAGAALILAAILATLLADRLTAPVRRAIEATQRIAGGDLGARVPGGSEDARELAVLAESINAMGESLQRAKGLERQFLLSVSHELRTPLTTIKGYSDALEDGTVDDAKRAHAAISAAAGRLDRLVGDLLDLAKLDARQFSMHLRRIDAAATALDALEGFRPEAGSLHIELATPGFDGTPMWVDADPDRLRQIVANLCENALKYARTRVSVSVDRRAETVQIGVTDDGPGISSADLPHVFDRHFTSDRVPARKVGSGLGLAIVDELAAAMGGRVTAESPLGEAGGTRLVVDLPARNAGSNG
jgi:two-component system sensor histidine kinase BaeS